MRSLRRRPCTNLPAVWPDWAIYCTLGNFFKPFATINLPKSPTFLGNFCKGVIIYHFTTEIIFGNFYRHLAIFFWSHCLPVIATVSEGENGVLGNVCICKFSSKRWCVQNDRTDESNHLFLNGPSRPLFHLFLVFFRHTPIQFFQQINVKKCPSSIWCLDSNSHNH